jgi:hypothetical protein
MEDGRERSSTILFVFSFGAGLEDIDKFSNKIEEDPFF